MIKIKPRPLPLLVDILNKVKSYSNPCLGDTQTKGKHFETYVTGIFEQSGVKRVKPPTDLSIILTQIKDTMTKKHLNYDAIHSYQKLGLINSPTWERLLISQSPPDLLFVDNQSIRQRVIIQPIELKTGQNNAPTMNDSLAKTNYIYIYSKYNNKQIARITTYFLGQNYLDDSQRQLYLEWENNIKVLTEQFNQKLKLSNLPVPYRVYARPKYETFLGVNYVDPIKMFQYETAVRKYVTSWDQPPESRQ